MNPQIEKLAEQAGFEEKDGHISIQGVYMFNTTRMEKLAELIVSECINQVREQYKPVMEDAAMMNDEHWKGYVQCGVDSVVAIREHFFGVEQ